MKETQARAIERASLTPDGTAGTTTSPRVMMPPFREDRPPGVQDYGVADSPASGRDLDGFSLDGIPRGVRHVDRTNAPALQWVDGIDSVSLNSRRSDDRE